MAPSSLPGGYHRFAEIYRLHLQGTDTGNMVLRHVGTQLPDYAVMYIIP
jgi:hypothetical protein